VILHLIDSTLLRIQAPIVVFDDADLKSAVNGAAFACFVASGQTCVSGTRLIVQEGIYDAFMGLFLEKVEAIRRGMGDREPNHFRSSPPVFDLSCSF
jgi:acyl-CoA reductase-like NAD-dependent aldehyde dehydrogenase